MTYQFTCPGCGYEATASGGKDAGFGCRTTTILCRDCGELRDVTTGTRPIDDLDSPAEWKPVEPRCSRGPAHQFEEWKHPGPCPKCGNMMDRGEVTMCWD